MSGSGRREVQVGDQISTRGKEYLVVEMTDEPDPWIKAKSAELGTLYARLSQVEVCALDRAAREG